MPPGEETASIPIRCFRPVWTMLGELEQEMLRAEVMEHFGLSKQRLMSDERVTLAYAREVLDYLNQKGVPEAGLLTGTSVQFGALGMLDYYLASCETIGEMLLHLVRYFPLLASGLPPFRIDRTDSEYVVITLSGPDESIAGDRALKEMVLGLIVRVITTLGNEQAWPQSVGFPYANLQRAVVVYLSQHGIRLVLQTDEYELSFLAVALDFALPFRDPAVQTALKPAMDEALHKLQAGISLANRIKDIFARSSDLAELSLLNIAPDLHMSQSSLKRKLKEEGASFSELLTDFKKTRAMELLTGSDIKLEALAQMLGYAERAPFERAFKNWFGETPAQLRQQFLASHLPVHDIEPSDIKAIPASPKICQDLVVMTRSEDFSTDKMGELVAKDPVLTGKLLGIANSAFYGGRKVNDISQAIINVLGVNQVRNLAIAMLSGSQLKCDACSAIQMTEFWAHSMATAEATTAFAKHPLVAAKIEAGEFYLAALLHSLGDLAFAYLRPQEMNEYLKLMRDSELHFEAADRRTLEKQVFGLSSHQMSALILTQWGLPDSIHKLTRAMEAADFGDYTSNLPAAVLSLLDGYFRGVVYFPGDEAPPLTQADTLAEILSLAGTEVQQSLNNVGTRMDEINALARQMCDSA